MNQWQRINGLLERALEQPPEDRDRFVAEESGGDAELARAVHALLQADADAGGFLEPPLVEREAPEAALPAAAAPEAATPAAAAEEPAPAGEPPAAGRRIGPYRLLRPIGQGGMSTVYLAQREDGLKRQVALKLIRRDMESDETQRRLRSERAILAHLDHPFVARLFDGGTTDEGLPYFVMERVAGEPIDRYCDQHRLTVRERLLLFQKILAAVHYAHQNLVVHRDLKPSNILVTADGSPKLLDFGIAKILNADLAADGDDKTATWMRVLTPSYASPEQLRGSPVTTASDVYSLGVLLTLLLTGTLPQRPSGATPRELDEQLAALEPQRPSALFERLEPAAKATIAAARGTTPEALEAQLRGDLDAVVMQALQPSPLHRYGSVEQLSRELQRHLDGFPVEAATASPAARAGKFVRRHRRAVTAAGLALAAAALLVALLIVQNARIARQRDRVLRERDTTARVLAFTERLLSLADPAVARGEAWTVRDALVQGGPLIDQELAGEARAAAQLHATVGRILLRLGEPEDAADHLDRALTLAREQFGGASPEVARALSELAEATVAGGDFTRGQEQAAQAAALYRRLGRGDDPGLVAALNTYVYGLCAAGDFTSADSASAEALALAEQLLEAGDAELDRARQNRATVLSRAGDAAGAEALHRQVLEHRRATLAEPHPLIASALGNLAAVLQQQQRYAEAERYYHLTLAQQRALLGDRHPDLAPTLHNLAALHQQAGQWAQAEEAYRQALELLPEDHFDHLRLRIELAALLAKTDRLEDSERMLRDELELWQPQLPPGNTLVAWAENTLGETLSAGGRLAEAEVLLTRTLPLIRERRGPGDPYTVKALRRLIRLYEIQGREADAQRYRQQLPTP